MNQSESVTFGAILYLDGHRIPGKKAFKNKTVFEGFKKAGGKFQEFKFKVPKPQPGSIQYPSPFTNAYTQLKMLQVSKFISAGRLAEAKHKGKYGTIIVEFFQTEEVERRVRKDHLLPSAAASAPAESLAARKRDAKATDKQD